MLLSPNWVNNCVCTLLFSNYFNCLYLAYVVYNRPGVSTCLFDIWDCYTRISIGIRAGILFSFLGEILGKILSGSCARKIVVLKSSMNLVSSYVRMVPRSGGWTIHDKVCGGFVWKLQGSRDSCCSWSLVRSFLFFRCIWWKTPGSILWWWTICLWDT